MFLPRGLAKFVHGCFYQEAFQNLLTGVLSEKVFPNSLMVAATRFSKKVFETSS